MPITRVSRVLLAFLLVVAMTSISGAYFWVREWKSGILWPEPPIVTPGTATTAPSDAIVLFDGTDLSAWNGGDQWIVANGEATVAKTSITSKQSFGDCQFHLEFATPAEVKGSGQGRGNSGIHFMGRYELQILDSFQNTTYFDGQCGSFYKTQPPNVNACRGPGEWQSYDVIFTAPRFQRDGSLKTPAYVTVLQNGVLIHNHLELKGHTSYTEPPRYTPHREKEPISIQHHGNPVRFRNIWVRENIAPLVGQQLGGATEPPALPEDARD